MIVTSVASSHQRASPGYPSVTARLKKNATLIAREISVIMPGSRSRSSRIAPPMNTQPPYRKTAVPKTGAM
jgi:hypothetical protein